MGPYLVILALCCFTIVGLLAIGYVLYGHTTKRKGMIMVYPVRWFKDGKLTGNKRYRQYKPWFKSPMVVLQVEYEILSGTGQHKPEFHSTAWRDATPEDVGLRYPTIPVRPDGSTIIVATSDARETIAALSDDIAAGIKAKEVTQ